VAKKDASGKSVMELMRANEALRKELAKMKASLPGSVTKKKAKGGMVKRAKGGMVKRAKGGMIKKMNGGVVRRSKGSMVKKAKGGMVKRKR
jgi:hypothetical protein